MHKQDEIDMPKTNPTRMLPNATIFHRLALGIIRYAQREEVTQILGFELGPRYQHVGGLTQREAPM